MDAQSWETVKALFDELADLPAAEQAERLAALGASTPSMRDAVASLLAADRRADEQLDAVDAAFLPPPRGHSPSSPADPFGLAGRAFAHFLITEALGAGGMGIVYRAVDSQLNRPVALKVPLAEYRLDTSARQRFLNEARSAAALDHPNLCSIYEVGESEGYPFIAMPLYAGETLKQRFTRGAPLSLDDAMAIARQVAEGLSALHAAGIIHRDVKPGNLMLLPDGGVKILDFGLAKLRDHTVTRSGMQLGTLGYMAPEQIRREAVDERADLWALGVVLYEMLTARRPFDGDQDVLVARAITNDAPLRPRAVRSDVPRELEVLVFRLLRKNPSRRPASARHVADELAMLKLERSRADRRSLHHAWIAATGWHQRGARRAALVMLSLALVAVAGGTIVVTASSRVPVASTASAGGSIAVLPFANLSGDPQQEYLSDGITEELTTRLVGVRGLRVAARSSAFSFKGRDLDVRRVGQALGVANVLHGSVRKANGRVRITAQLIDATSGYHLWSQTWDRELSDIFHIQDEISEAIVSALPVGVTLPIAEHTRPTRNVEAYELYLKGRWFWNQRTEDALVRATEYFQQAVALDPEYAAPYAGLADVEIAPRAGHPSERFARASLAAERALALDSLLAEAHVSMSWIRMWYDRDWAGAERHIRRAVSLSPGSTWAVSRHGAFLAATGRVEESLPLLLRAHELDPLSYVHATYVGTHLIWLGRDDDAIRYFRKALELAPAYYMAHWGLGRAYLRQGRHAEALQEFAYEGGDYTGLNRVGLLGHAHALAGNHAEARRILRGLHESAARGDYVPALAPTIIHIALGETSLALDWLERVEHERGARVFLVDPIFDPIRSEPRFQELQRRLRLTQARR